MAEIVNLRQARKRAERRKKEDDAASRRVAHGTPKALRKEIAAERSKADRDLEGHRLGKDDE
jgi:hypothetical protein